MANYNAGTVQVVNTTGLVTGPITVSTIKVVASAAGSLTIKYNDSSGNKIYECTFAAAGEIVDNVPFYCNKDIYVTATNVTAYLYTKK